jgi:hypothetical protein
MATKPTDAQAARRILWIMVQRLNLRENGVAHDNNFQTTFPGSGFKIEDFQPGMNFAVLQDWVERIRSGPSPGLRLTARGFNAAPELEREQMQSMALRLLAAVHEKTRNTGQPIFVVECAPALGLSDDEVEAAWRYLRDKGLIETFNLDYTARINAYGTDLIEKAQQCPDQPTPGFGAVTYNTLHIYRMEHSTVQQAGAHSTQTQIVNYGQKDFDDLRHALDLLEQHFGELNLDASAGRKALAQVATIKAQLTDDPNPVIIKEAGRTLRNLTEGAIAGLIATAVQPGVWQIVSDIFGRMFGG